MGSSCLFCRIAGKELGTPLLYEDDRAVAFRDINPQAAFHALVIPRRHVETIDAIGAEHEPDVGHLFAVAARLAKDAGLTAGYRTVMNCGADAGQTVFHLHLHVLGGAPMGWPPFPPK
jgi:histidine triad (HIT) family protein